MLYKHINNFKTACEIVPWVNNGRKIVKSFDSSDDGIIQKIQIMYSCFRGYVLQRSEDSGKIFTCTLNNGWGVATLPECLKGLY